MFTGIIEELGKITKKTPIEEGYRFRVKGNKTVKKLKVSNSISINGVCHTVIGKKGNEFEFISMHETLKKTNLGTLNINDDVNLENSLRLGGEIGGHFVLGHVDDTGVITGIKQVKSKKQIKKESENWEFRIKVHKRHRKFIINVGSVAVDGVSLTVARIYPVKGSYFEIMVAIIPYTYHITNFHNYKIGSKVNLEFDFLGKYVLNLFRKNK
jgi:riboflavin synthase